MFVKGSTSLLIVIISAESIGSHFIQLSNMHDPYYLTLSCGTRLVCSRNISIIHFLANRLMVLASVQLKIVIVISTHSMSK